MRFYRLVLLVMFFAFSTAALSVNGQTTANQSDKGDARWPDIQGNWQGNLGASLGKLRLVLKISRTADGTLKAAVDSPDQGVTDLRVDTFTFKDSYVHFEMKYLQASFDGGLSRDGTEIAGQFRQISLSPLVLRRDSSGAAVPPPALGLTRGRIKLEPCHSPALTKDAGCGKYEVLEDRTAKSGRKIALNIVVLPAISAKPAPDPVFILAGGPGQGAARVVKGAGDYLIKLRRERDLVFVDQRGTGDSNPLNCNQGANKDEMRGYFTEGTIEGLRECRAQLEKNANLALYTTPIAMDDLDEARTALGYEKINLLGGSYGTFAASVYIRQHGDHVRGAILEGVSPVEGKIYLGFAKGVEHSLERLFADCAADKDCNTAFPNPRAELKEVAAKLDKQPATFEAVNLFNGKREQITLTRAIFGEQLRTMLYLPLYWRWVPLLIHEANKNNFGPFASIAYTNLRGLTDQFSVGMALSVLCSEDVPFITEDEIKRETAGTFYGDNRIRTSIKNCEQWARGKVEPSFSEAVKSNVPILMVTGDLDPVAPPWLAAGASRFLPNSRHITIPNTGHYFRFECVDDLFVKFLNAGSAKGLDDSCVKEIERPPFVTQLPPQLSK